MSQGSEDDDLEPEYDFSGAMRGKYYRRTAPRRTRDLDIRDDLGPAGGVSIR